MTFSIGSIIWPNDSTAAIHLYLGFQVKVLDALNINFRSFMNDPLALTKEYLKGDLSNEELDAAAAAWWSYLDKTGSVQNFVDRNALMARLAICLLSVKEKDVPELGEHLSWFLEVLGFLGTDLDEAIKIMETYFNF